MRNTALRLAAISVIAALGVLGLGALPAQASDVSVTFGIQAASGHTPDQRANFQFGGGPGSAPFRDSVSVLNIGDVPLHLALYPADAVSTTDGQFAVKLQTQTQDDVGSWIKLAQGPQISIPARTAAGASRLFVPFTLTIPKDATPGDHVGAIMVSLRTAAGASGRAREAQVKRVGIRVYVRVSGTVRASLAIEHLTSTYGPALQANPFGTGHVTVSYVVHNTGNVILGANQHVSVSGLFGSTDTTTPVQVAPLLPGDSVRERSVLTGVFPEFAETAKVTLHPLAPVGAVDSEIKTVSQSSTAWAVPWSLLVLLVLIVVAGTWYLRRRLTAGGAHSKKRPVAAGKGRA